MVTRLFLAVSMDNGRMNKVEVNFMLWCWRTACFLGEGAGMKLLTQMLTSILAWWTLAYTYKLSVGWWQLLIYTGTWKSELFGVKSAATVDLCRPSTSQKHHSRLRWLHTALLTSSNSNWLQFIWGTVEFPWCYGKVLTVLMGQYCYENALG